MLSRIEKILGTMNISDKMVAIAIIAVINESDEIHIPYIVEKCIPLAFKLDELHPNNLVKYAEIVNSSYIIEKLASFKELGIVHEKVISQFNEKSYYKNSNARLTFFGVPSNELEMALNNDEVCSIMIELVRENIVPVSTPYHLESEAIDEIEKMRKDLNRLYNQFDKKLKEFETKFQIDR